MGGAGGGAVLEVRRHREGMWIWRNSRCHVFILPSKDLAAAHSPLVLILLSPFTPKQRGAGKIKQMNPCRKNEEKIKRYSQLGVGRRIEQPSGVHCWLKDEGEWKVM